MGLDHILLGLLRQPASGYDLKKVFDHGIGHFWSAELSQIYPALNRLQKKGMLRRRRAASKRGPGRLLYETTSAGRRALRGWLLGEPALGDDRFSYLAQIYLMDELADTNQTLRFFQHLRERFARKLEGLQAIERHWRECDPRYPDDLPLPEFHVQLTLRTGLLTLTSKVNWCDESIRRLRARLKKESRHGRILPRTTVGAHRRRLYRADFVLDSGGRP